MGSGSTGPLAWWAANADVMVLCHLISLVSSGILVFVRSVRGTSVVVAFLSSILFTELVIPVLTISWGWAWPNLMIASALIGFGSMTLAFTAIKVSETLQRRAIEGAATWGGDKFPPLTPPPSGQEQH